MTAWTSFAYWLNRPGKSSNRSRLRDFLNVPDRGGRESLATEQTAYPVTFIR
jgi:hypothetical protein